MSSHVLYDHNYHSNAHMLSHKKKSKRSSETGAKEETYHTYDKCNAIMLTNWWVERRTCCQGRCNLGNKLKCCTSQVRSKYARIAAKKVKYHTTMCLANATSENDKKDRSLIQEIEFHSNSFSIGVNTFASCCMSNNLD